MWGTGLCLVLWKVRDAVAFGGVGPRRLGKSFELGSLLFASSPAVVGLYIRPVGP